MNSRPCVICAHAATQKCGGCKKPHYCSKEHQQEAWPKHKRLCRIYQMDNPPDPSTYCGLCGKRGPLVQTECCGHFLCKPPENEYDTKVHILDICARNHSKYTLCGLHKEHTQENRNWRDCSKCKTKFPKIEMYVGYGTKNYNFDCENWNPPKFEVTRCAECGVLIHLNTTAHILRQLQNTVVCQKHQEIPESMLRSMLATGNLKLESFGMS